MLCHFSRHFPPFVANFLERARGLKRRFREETITDMLMANLVVIGPPWLFVEFPVEKTTGADMEWNFFNEDNNTFFRLLIQAKQLYESGKTRPRFAYKKLHYAPQPGTLLQASILADHARQSAATFPLYAFYNHETGCKFGNIGNQSPKVHGVNLADGFEIERLLKPIATRKSTPTSKSLLEVQPFFFQLANLFCPDLLNPLGTFMFGGGEIQFRVSVTSTGQRSLGVPWPLRPEDIRSRLAQLREASRRDYDLEPVPEVSKDLPEDLRVMIGRRVGSVREGSPFRWRVLFKSRNPRQSES